MESERDGDYRLLSSGRWIDFLRRIPRPVLAFGNNEIYRVMVHGKDFILPIEGSKPAVGFFTTRFVAAKDFQTAKSLVIKLILDEWLMWGYEKFSGNSPMIVVEEAVNLGTRFRLRTGAGFTFYLDDD